MNDIPKLGSDEYKLLLHRLRELRKAMHNLLSASLVITLEIDAINRQLHEIELAHSQQEAQRG